MYPMRPLSLQHVNAVESLWKSSERMYTPISGVCTLCEVFQLFKAASPVAKWSSEQRLLFLHL